MNNENQASSLIQQMREAVHEDKNTPPENENQFGQSPGLEQAVDLQDDSLDFAKVVEIENKQKAQNGVMEQLDDELLNSHREESQLIEKKDEK